MQQPAFFAIDLLEPSARPALRTGGQWLVRPDRYTACVAKAEDVGVFAAYLEALGSTAVQSTA